jgi:hypothetical protein
MPVKIVLDHPRRLRVLNPYVDIVATTFNGRLPVDAIAFSLPGMFAILAVGLAGVVIALGTALTAAPLVWVMTAVVLRVASNIWRQTVSRIASVSSVALIDVSEPTGNLIWEIEELTRRSQTKCVDDMGRLLEMEEILAYTTDRSGIKRFARALRGALLSRAA